MNNPASHFVILFKSRTFMLGSIPITCTLITWDYASSEIK